MKFLPGDRVVLVKSFNHLKSGDTGTFVHKEDDWPELGVRWDKEYQLMHNCDGHCDNNHGWYVPFGYLDYESSVDLGDLPEAGDIDLLLY